jgi:hypothetical protein
MIKNWIEFIKESFEVEELYRFSDEKIKNLFVEMMDEGYTIFIEHGFVISQIRRYGETEVFDQKLISGESVRPAYWVSIHDKRVTNLDVTDSLLTAIDYLEDKKFEVVLDDSGVLDRDAIKVKGGFFIDDDLQAEGDLCLFIKDTREVEVTNKDLCEFYKWKPDEIIGDDIYIYINMEDLADIILKNKDSYKEQLINGIEEKYYYSSEHQPDTQSLFQYYLDKDNKLLIIKLLIKEYGGLEEFVKESDNDNLEGLSEDEVVSFLLKERFYSTLDKLCKDSEMVQEVKQIYGDMSVNAHMETNYNELVGEFDDIVGKSVYFDKFDKEVDVNYTQRDKDGNTEVKTYKEVKKFYKIKYSNDWITDFDSDFLMDESLYDVFSEYARQDFYSYELSPHFSDYGDVDYKIFNDEVKSLLKFYINNK